MDEQDLINLLKDNLELQMYSNPMGDIEYKLWYGDTLLDQDVCDCYELRTYEGNE